MLKNTDEGGSFLSCSGILSLLIGHGESGCPSRASAFAPPRQWREAAGGRQAFPWKTQPRPQDQAAAPVPPDRCHRAQGRRGDAIWASTCRLRTWLSHVNLLCCALIPLDPHLDPSACYIRGVLSGGLACGSNSFVSILFRLNYFCDQKTNFF